MDAPEIITALSIHDLRPFDMIDEGIFIHDLWWGNDTGWYVAPLTIETVDVNGTALKSPAWGRPIDRPMKFPMKVVRGAPPPAAH